MVAVAPISFFINFEPCTHLSTGVAFLFPKTTVCHGSGDCCALGGLMNFLNCSTSWSVKCRLIGPRPLLPKDQPTNSKLRLLARPGITGWAQVNGGNLVTDDEKGALDEWYVRHASFWLDLRIVTLTLGFMFRGEHRSEPALRQALLEQRKGHFWKKPASSRKNVREELRPALRGPLPSRAKSIKIRAQLEAQPDQ